MSDAAIGPDGASLPLLQLWPATSAARIANASDRVTDNRAIRAPPRFTIQRIAGQANTISRPPFPTGETSCTMNRTVCSIAVTAFLLPASDLAAQTKPI